MDYPLANGASIAMTDSELEAAVERNMMTEYEAYRF